MHLMRYFLSKKSDRCAPKGKTIKCEMAIAQASLKVLSTACARAGVKRKLVVGLAAHPFMGES